MMKIKRFWMVLFLLSMVGCTTDFDEAVRLEEKELNELFARKDVVKDVLTVKFSRETADALSVSRTRSGELATGNVTLDEICREYEVVEIERVFPINKYEPRKRAMGLDLWYTVKVGGRRAAGDAALRLKRMEGVQSVVPQVKVKRAGSSEIRYATEEEIAAISAKNATRAADYMYDDPLLPEQWMLKNIGVDYNTSFVEGADINVEGAWQKCGGSNNVIVAVVDGGVEHTHPDLAANMWEGIGRNFVGSKSGRADIEPDEHGTHVAGTVAAVSNNGIGISGIAGGSGRGDGVKLISCQIFTEDDSATDVECAAAIVFGADNGAVISQNSWGYAINYVSNETAFKSRFGCVKDAIDYFVRMAGMNEDGTVQVGPMAGGVVIFAAGNDGKQQSEYPASYGECLSVAAMTGSFTATYYTTYSTMVDLFAPGGGSSRNSNYDTWNLSTLPTHIKNGDTFKQDGKTYIVDYIRTPGYGYMIGTSMACPHVSGAAALIVSYCGGVGFTNTRLKELLLGTARDVDGYQDSSHKGKVGKLVDVTAAVELGGAGTNYTPLKLPLLVLKSTSNTLYMLPKDKTQLVYELHNCDRIEVSDSRVEMSRIDDMLVLEIDSSLFDEGLYKMTVTAYNDDGEGSAEFSILIEGISAKVYPNPCDDELNIQLNPIKGAYQNCSAKVCIYNSVGAAVYNDDVEFNSRYPLTFNVEKLNPGRYEVCVDVEFEDYRQTIKRTVVKR